jgi:hypothetical protein
MTPEQITAKHLRAEKIGNIIMGVLLAIAAIALVAFSGVLVYSAVLFGGPAMGVFWFFIIAICLCVPLAILIYETC